jgi:2'-5' RNA ligase
VSPEVREKLVSAQEELRKTGADVKLVEMDNLHFTVKFLGEKDERAYHPHITLARVRSATNLEALQALLGAYASKDFGRTPIMMLKLKSSTLTPRGPAYRDIKEYTLK